MVDTSADFCPSPQIDPTVQRKVHTLGTVESQVEARMVSSRESDDVFPLVMDQHVDSDTVFGETSGRHDVCFVS